MFQVKSNQHSPTPRLLIASLSKPTTLFPSAPEALKPLVQLIKIPWEIKTKTIRNQKKSEKMKKIKIKQGETSSHLIKVLVTHWKREGKTQWKLLVLDVVFVQKIRHALCYVVKQLGERNTRMSSNNFSFTHVKSFTPQ